MFAKYSDQPAIRAVWSEFLQRIPRVAKDPKPLQADSEDSD